MFIVRAYKAPEAPSNLIEQAAHQTAETASFELHQHLLELDDIDGEVAREVRNYVRMFSNIIVINVAHVFGVHPLIVKQIINDGITSGLLYGRYQERGPIPYYWIYYGSREDEAHHED